ncbi:MAG: hypothetical protein IPL26_28410 [Leptospiraceae bacterium]|nr:hypothetical protein [Leptospiraceae bacterium]
MQTNMHQIIKRFIRFLTFFFLLSLMTGCFLFEEDKESKHRAKNKQLFTILISIPFNQCLGQTNMDITEGQTLGPYTVKQCFKITINANTSVTMLTPSNTTGNLRVWSSDPFPSRRDALYRDDPTFAITGPGIWYAYTNCDTCTSYSISIQ